MNKLNTSERAQVIRCLVDGNSMRATERITGITINAIMRLIVDAGEVCREYQDKALQNLTTRRVQADEIWSFCGSKEKNTKAAKKEQGWGDVWTWTAIDADSKLIMSWLVGDRGASCAHRFMQDVASRIKNRIQLTTDGYKAYFDAVEDAFLGEIDYAILHKIYGTPPNEAGSRYSPAKCLGIKINLMNGEPEYRHISTSYVERQNLTMRMGMRRFTRLTNGFSKKIENHAAAIALHFMYYNFARVHQALRITPAMAAGISDHVWEIEEIVALLDVKRKPMKRGPYKKRSA